MIDFHVHPILLEELAQQDPDYERAAREIFHIGNNFQPLETLLLEMDVSGVHSAVLLPIACRRSCGVDVVTNEQIVELCSRSPRFIGFCSVDPMQPGAPETLDTYVRQRALKGLYWDAELQGFDPDDPEIIGVLEKAQELEIPVMVRTGLSWAPATSISANRPLLWEPVIRKFPKLNIVLTNFGWPWVWEAAVLAMKYSNVYLDLAAHFFDSPMEFFGFVYSGQLPLTLLDRALADRVLFGSNYPRVEIKNMVRAFVGLGLSESSRRKIGRENAHRLLRI